MKFAELLASFAARPLRRHLLTGDFLERNACCIEWQKRIARHRVLQTSQPCVNRRQVTEMVPTGVTEPLLPAQNQRCRWRESD